jgi:hypothetical protein
MLYRQHLFSLQMAFLFSTKKWRIVKKRIPLYRLLGSFSQ